MRFGSAEQALLTLLSIAMFALVLRILRSKFRFRFASLLLLTAFSAVLFRVVLRPLKRQTDQNTAMTLVQSQGGSFRTFGRPDRYPQNAEGWVMKSGYLYPAVLAYLEEKYLNPVEIHEARIPSSLIDRSTWSSLNCNYVQKIEVVLDGAGNARDLSDILQDSRVFFPDWDSHFYRPLVFVAGELREGDIAFLNKVRWGGNRMEMPVIRMSPDGRFDPKLLELLEPGFEFLLEGSVADSNPMNRSIQLTTLKRVTLYRFNDLKTVLQSIEKRLQVLPSLLVYECNFDAESWRLLCKSNNVRSLRISQARFQGPSMPATTLEELGQNESIEELIVYLDESQATAIPSLMKMERLKRIEVHCTAHLDSEIIHAVRHSNLKSVWLEMEPPVEDLIEPEPWMERLDSFMIGKKQFVAPK